MFSGKICLVVESVHAIPAYRRVFSEIGIQSVNVIATMGRLRDLESAAGLSSIMAIQTSREYLHPHVANKLKGVRDSLVYVATDLDAEGDLIASDAHVLLSGRGNEVFRLRSKEISARSMASSLVNARAIDPQDSTVALARRGIDKYIQLKCDSGRVSARALAQVTEDPYGDRITEALPLVACSGENTLSILVGMAVRNVAPGQAMASLQMLYSSGAITYPRTLSGLDGVCELSAEDAHGCIQRTSLEASEIPRMTNIDEQVLGLIERPEELRSISMDALRNRHVKALLTLGTQPYCRSSTIAHHSSNLVRNLSSGKTGLTSYGERELFRLISDHPALVSDAGSRELSGLIYSSDHGSHVERIVRAVEMISGLRQSDLSEMGHDPVPSGPGEDFDEFPAV